MGYCERHETVYAGQECPVCADEESAGDGTGPDRPAEGPATRDGQDGPRSSSGGPPSRAPDSDRKSHTTDGDDRIAEEIDDALDGGVSAEAETGDVVVGDQSKSVDRSERVEVDESETVVDRSDVHRDERTVVNDSVVNRSNVGGDDNATVDDSVVNRSNVGGETGGNSGPDSAEQSRSDVGPSASDSGNTHCPDCGSGVGADDAFCTSCGARLPDGA